MLIKILVSSFMRFTSFPEFCWLTESHDQRLQVDALLVQCYCSAGAVLEQCWSSAGAVLEQCWSSDGAVLL